MGLNKRSAEKRARLYCNPVLPSRVNINLPTKKTQVLLQWHLRNECRREVRFARDSRQLLLSANREVGRYLKAFNEIHGTLMEVAAVEVWETSEIY